MRDKALRIVNVRALTRGLFNSRVEENLSLRVITLAMGWWVALSLAWVGSPAWVWLGGGALLTCGHGFSWYLRSWKSSVRSMIVGAGIVGALALVPYTVLAASSGDRLPIANFLLVLQAATSFELRTRGGLYVNIGTAGIIFLLVALRALDATFVVFLVGFITLLLSFFATSFIVDQARDVEVRWFRRRLSFAWFWTSVFVAALAISAGVFTLLPKRIGDPVRDARGVVLPVRANEEGSSAGTGPEFGPIASALPLRAPEGAESPARPDLAAAQGAPETPAQLQGEGPGDELADGPARPDLTAAQGAPEAPAQLQGEGPGDGLGGGPARPDLTAAQGAPEAPAQLQGGEPDAGPSESRAPEQAEVPTPPVQEIRAAGRPDDPLLMQVRSSVLTYWRGQVFDIFDGQSWRPDPRIWTVRSRGPGRIVYTAWEGPRIRGERLYSQTYFLRHSPAPNTVFTGYAPLFVPLPVAGDGTPLLADGTVYRVISRLPDFSPGAIAAAPSRAVLSPRYHQLPPYMATIQALTQQFSTGDYTDLQRMLGIVTYVNRSYELDEEAVDQLAPTASPLEFLTSRSTGTSMDFAATTVLLARIIGVPARLVTGYLPGRFDHLSGTYLVHGSDRHAWAEVYVRGVGWVPFDSTSRLATASLGEGGTYSSPFVNALFSVGYGDEIYASVGSSPRWMGEVFSSAFDAGGLALTASLLAAVVLVIGAVVVWRLWLGWRRRRGRTRYTRLMGDGRAEILRIYLLAERLLRRTGLAPRDASQTMTDYAAQAEPRLGDARGDLAWLRSAAWAAAYDPASYGSGPLPQARERLARLRAAIKARRRRPRQHLRRGQQARGRFEVAFDPTPVMLSLSKHASAHRGTPFDRAQGEREGAGPD